jgi:hypothetical protein
MLTGNYTFFNINTIALCLSLFDDAFLSNFFPNKYANFTKRHYSVLQITPGVNTLKDANSNHKREQTKNVECHRYNRDYCRCKLDNLRRFLVVAIQN